MLTYRFMLSTIFQICLLLAGTVAFTQDSPGQWVGDLYHVSCYTNSFKRSSALIDENNKIHKIIPDIKLEKDFFKQKRESFFNYPNWYNAALYVTDLGSMEKNKDKSGFERWTFAKYQNDKWHSLGYYKMESGDNLLKIIPCDNDRFIVIFLRNKGMDPKSRSKMTPFHLMSLHPDKTEFSIDESIDHGQEALRIARPNYFELAYKSDIIMTDRHATLLSKDTGLYWIFSLENASLLKAGNIFKEETAKMIGEGGFTNSPILCANPEKQGTLLIAAQEEAFFTTETRNFWQEYNKLINIEPYRRMSDEDVMEKLYVPMHREFVNRSPFIVWYRLNPETGEVEKLKEPPVGGSNLRDEGKNDIWRPMPDGSVSTAPILNTITSEVERQLKNRSADFSPATLREMADNLIKAVVEKRFRNGIADFSISSLKSELENQLQVEVENNQISVEVKNQLMAEVENLLKPVEKQLKEFENQFKNRIAEEQKDKKASDTK